MQRTITTKLFIPEIFLCILTFATLCLSQESIQLPVKNICDSLLSKITLNGALPRIAVIPFSYHEDSSGTGPGLLIAERFVTYLSNSNKIKLVDRDAFKWALKELKLSNSALVDQTNALKLGKFETAQYLLLGSVEILDNKLTLYARIIDVETTEIVASQMQQVSTTEVQDLTKELFNEKSKVHAPIFRSVILPGWGQIYTDHYWRGGICLALTAAAGGVTIYKAQTTAESKKKWRDWETWMKSSKYLDYLHERSKAGDNEAYYRDSIRSGQLYKRYSRNYDHMVIAATSTAAMWLINIIDASVAGVQAHKKYAPYFTGSLSGSAEAGICITF